MIAWLVVLLQSVPLLVNGSQWCQASPAADGWYTARHCVVNARTVVVGGAARRWSVDPTRDLAHMAGPATGVTYRDPVPGEPGFADWRGSRDASVLFDRTVTAVEVGGRYVYTASGRPMQQWCVIGGWAAQYGDSGSGVWLADGSLAGIVVAMEPIVGGRFALDSLCGTAQAVLVEGVP